jgi:hypothetical protein
VSDAKQIGAIREKRVRAAALGYRRAPRKDAIDLLGLRFHRLVVLSRVPPAESANNNAEWLCRCDCGSLHRVRGTRLRSGEIKSCGCYRRDTHIPWLRSRLQELRQLREVDG